MTLVELEGRQLKLSNLEKVLYPEAGFTKGQVIDYYHRIAPALLRQIKGRPLTLKLHWQPLRALPLGLQLQVELRPDGASQTYTVALPLPNDLGDPAAPPGERAVGTYQVPIPADLPPGSYVLAVRLLGADGRPLPVTTQPTRPPGVPSEADAVPLRRIQIR